MGSKYAQDIARIEERTLNIKRILERVEDKLDRINGTVDDHDVEIARLNTKLGIWGRSQAALTLIAAGVAGWLGVSR